MKSSRRKFLGTLAAAGCVPAVGERAWTLVSAAMAETTATPEQSEEFDRDALDFWQHNHLTRRKARGQSEDPTALAMGGARVPEFLLFTPEDGFRVASEIPDKELYALGDVRISLQVEAFKPSGEDHQEFANLKTGALRIDLEQGKPQNALMDALVRSAVAALNPDKAGKLPPLAELKFDPATTWGKARSIPVPGGGGYWTWNFFVQKRDSLLSRISQLVGAAAKFTPVLGLPGLAVTAMKAFNNFFGFVQANARSNWLFQAASIPVVATKEVRQQPEFANGVPVRTGDYIVVPRGHLKRFGDAMKNYELKRGVVVPKGTKPHEVYDAASATLPDVTYLTLSMGVRRYEG
jgi:hypothetical protein